jgi:hypothetical protein
MGTHLAQTVHRGGHGSKSNDATSKSGGSSAGLPKDISKQLAGRYRKVAAVSDDLFAAYLAQQKAAMEFPSSSGLLKCGLKASKAGKKPRGGKHRPPSGQAVAVRVELESKVEVPANVIEAVKRVLQVEVLVGGNPRAFPKAQYVKADLLKDRDLRDDVFIADCLDPTSWLPQLVEAAVKRRLVQVAVALPASTSAPWFKRLEQGRWACCFLRGAPLAVAYKGDQKRLFWGVFQELGTVMLAGDASDLAY